MVFSRELLFAEFAIVLLVLGMNALNVAAECLRQSKCHLAHGTLERFLSRMQCLVGISFRGPIIRLRTIPTSESEMIERR